MTLALERLRCRCYSKSNNISFARVGYKPKAGNPKRDTEVDKHFEKIFERNYYDTILDCKQLLLLWH